MGHEDPYKLLLDHLGLTRQEWEIAIATVGISQEAFLRFMAQRPSHEPGPAITLPLRRPL